MTPAPVMVLLKTGVLTALELVTTVAFCVPAEDGTKVPLTLQLSPECRMRGQEHGLATESEGENGVGSPIQ